MTKSLKDEAMAYSIDNDDFLYVLSTFVYSNIWTDLEKPTRKEKEHFYFFKEEKYEDYREFKAFP